MRVVKSPIEIHAFIILARKSRFAIEINQVLRLDNPSGVRFAPGIIHRLHYRIHEYGRAEHKLIVDIIDLAVACKIKRKSAHDRIIVVCHFPAERINIGHQPVAKVVEFQLCVVRPGSFFAEPPDLARSAAAMDPEDRTECAVLIPARK